MSEPLPSAPETPRAPASDTQHRPTFRENWSAVMTTRHSPREWSIITAAVATADTATIAPSGVRLTRGGEDWCRIAVTAMESPAAAEHAATIPDRLPDHCLFDPQLLHAWLGAPVASGSGHSFIVTVADQVADRDLSYPPDQTTQEAVEALLAKAQRAGVFGVDGYDLELYGVTGETGWIEHQLLVARPHDGPGLASNLFATVVPDTPSRRVDGAVAVLSMIARAADTLLRGVDRPSPAATPRDRTVDHGILPPRDADVPYRIGPDGRPFPALDQVDPAATTPPAPPPPPTEPVSDRRR